MGCGSSSSASAKGSNLNEKIIVKNDEKFSDTKSASLKSASARHVDVNVTSHSDTPCLKAPVDGENAPANDTGSKTALPKSTTANEGLKEEEGDLKKEEGDLKKGEGDLTKVEGDLKKEEGDLKKEEGDLKKEERRKWVEEQKKSLQAEADRALELMKQIEEMMAKMPKDVVKK